MSHLLWGKQKKTENVKRNDLLMHALEIYFTTLSDSMLIFNNFEMGQKN